MPWLINDPAGLREHLKDKTIYLLVYCHADVAWTHTRRWHVNRYALILDEVLDLLESGPHFRYFIDSWTEMLRPYIEARPRSRARIVRALDDGRLSLCGAQWGNLRMTQVGCETMVRNMVFGRRAAAELAPHFRPTIYSNLDVGIGHSQVPQLLALGGYTGYLAWRPSSALDEQGVPRSFVWEGLSGDTVRVCRMSYGTGNSVPVGPWGEDWDRSLDCMGPDIEVAAAQPGVSAVGLFIGMDDTRPLRLWGNDKPSRTDELIDAWHSHGVGVMGYGTPEELFAHLDGDDLPVVAGTLDEAEVCYNLNWLGHRSLAWWREKADRALVEAEVLDAIAALKGGLSRRHSLRRCWQLLLDACPHAQQALLRDDEHQRYCSLTDAVRTADSVRRDALNALLPVCLPLDATHLAFINPSPVGGRRIVRTTVPSHDRTYAGFALLDEDGRELPMQFTGSLFLRDEFEVELALDLPPCGVRACRIEWRAEPVHTSQPRDLPLDTEVIDGNLTLRFEGGRLRQIENTSLGIGWQASDSCCLLTPSVQNYTGGTWLPDALSPDPVPADVKSLRLADSGPLRTRVTRVIEAGLNVFTQHLDMYGEMGEVRVTTDMLLRDEGIYAGLALPTPPDAELAVDIPFGVESRNPAAVPYGVLSDIAGENLERRIPGYFWGRSWLDVHAGETSLALLSEDGDRFFWQHPSREWLTHFFLRVPRQARGGWEAHATFGDAVGRHVFHHLLLLHPADRSPAMLVRRAEQLRMPVRWTPVKLSADQPSESWLAIEPDTVQLSTFYCEGHAWALRVHNPDALPRQVTVTLPVPCLTASLTDFNLERIAGEASVEDKTIRFALAPWQIVTLLLRF